MTRLLVVVAALALGLAVAEATGVRALGGAILIAAAAWLLRTPRGWAYVVLMGVLFVLAHVASGAWG